MSREIGFLTWILVVYIIGVGLFTSGYLTARRSLNSVSNSSNSPYSPLFDKAIIIIIDALKFEFAYYNASRENETTTNYLNHLSIFQNLSESHFGVLLEVHADPPTTTLQRLKALTTGSLPTFIEVSQNFGSSEITEDNWITQSSRAGKKIVFAGDDTWSGMFPKGFLRSYPFPSFDVSDLDTVDKGVLSALKAELEINNNNNIDNNNSETKEKWSVFIGHFLGVDHAGHRFGAKHEEMRRKLIEMNEMISYVSKTMSNETLLFVLGDHGMTLRGDHGGDSIDEISTTLFMYNKKYKVERPNGFYNQRRKAPLSQIDFVPTLSALLGLSIPFSNLGAFIPLFQNQEAFQSRALQENVRQIYTYLSSYVLENSVGKTFSKKAFESLSTSYESLENQFNLSVHSPSSRLSLDDKSLQFLIESKDHCVSLWITFDTNSLVVSLTLLVLLKSLLWILVHFLSFFTFSNALNGLLFGVLSLGALGALLLSEEPSLFRVLGVGGLSSVMFFGFHLLWSLRNVLLPHKCVSLQGHHHHHHNNGGRGFNFPSGLLLLFYYLSFLSNSFVMEENYVLYFLSITFFALQLVSLNNGVSLVVFLLGTLSLRLSTLYFPCLDTGSGSSSRWNCETSYEFVKDLGSLSSSSYNFKNIRFFFAILSSALLSWLPHLILSKSGNLNGVSLTVSLLKVTPTLMALLNISYWALGSLSPSLSSTLFHHHQTHPLSFLPRISLSLCLAVLLLLLFFPSSLVYIHQYSSCSFHFPTVRRLGVSLHHPHSLFSLIKSHWKTLLVSRDSSDSSSSSTLRVYGLGSSLFCTHLSVLTLLSLASLLFLGDGLAPSVLLYFISLASTFVLVFLSSSSSSSVSTFSVSFESLTLYWLLSRLFFYSSGHLTVFSSIQWNAGALLGISNDSPLYFTSSFLSILTNTFLNRILSALSLPLLHLSFSFLSLSLQSPGSGNLSLLSRDSETHKSMLSLFLRYSLLESSALLSSLASSAFHRRHLMTFRVFAPKVLFEALGFLVSQGSLLLSYALWSRFFGSFLILYKALVIERRLEAEEHQT